MNRPNALGADWAGSRQLEARLLTPDEYSSWDELVERTSCGTIFHSSKWLELCSRHFNVRPRVYGCWDGQRLIGGCSLFLRSLAPRNLLVIASGTCPLTAYGGFVVATDEGLDTKKAETNHHAVVAQLLLSIGGDHLDKRPIVIPNAPGFNDVRPLTWAGWDSAVRYTYRIALQKDADLTMGKDIRKKVRLCEREGVQVVRLHDAELHHRLVALVFARQGLPPPATTRFFRDALDTVVGAGIGGQWVARTPSGNYIASHIRLWDGKRAYNWSAGSDRTHADGAANAYTYYSVLNDLRSLGFREMDAAQANTPRFSQFFAGFRPTLVPCFVVSRHSQALAMARALYNAGRPLLRRIVR